MTEPQRLDLNRIFRESYALVTRNFPLVLPTMFSLFIASYVSGSVLGDIKLELGATEISADDFRRVGMFLFINIVVAAWFHAMTVAMAAMALKGGPASFFAASAIMVNRILAVLPVTLLIGASVTLGLMLLVPGVLAAYVSMFALPSAVIGGTSAFDSFRQSMIITRRRARDSAMTFAALFGMMVVVSVLEMALMLVNAFVAAIVSIPLSAFMGALAAAVIARVYTALSAQPQEERQAV